MKKHALLYKTLGYTFDDPLLLRQALTHRSHNKNHYERLEFLGDSVLNFVITAKLYELHPKVSEGSLTRMRARLVRGHTLAEIGQELNIGPFLLLGTGELKSGGRFRDSIIADTMEAIFGAVFCDGGLVQARKLILSCYKERLTSLSPEVSLKDPKTILQEWCQSKQYLLPKYELEKVVEKPKEQIFHVSCTVKTEPTTKKSTQAQSKTLTTKGSGTSRRRGEQAAAELMLKKIQGANK